MKALDKLRKLIADIETSADPILWNILREGTEGDWDCEVNDDRTISNVLADIVCDLSAEQLADSSDYADLQGEIFGVCQALGVELEEGDTGSQALTRLHKAVTYLPFVRQSMDNIEREVKDGVNSIAERLGIRDEIKDTSIAKVCPRIVEELDRRLMPEGVEWDGSVLRIRTAENVDYDGETLFVLIGGRDE